MLLNGKRAYVIERRIKICAIAALLIGVIALSLAIGVVLGSEKEPLKEILADPSVLRDLAYDEQPQFGYVVYLEEGEAFEPYYVLTSSYYGRENQTLLLRKYVLDEPREYEPYLSEGYYHAYYENSSIDRFLSVGFYETLSPAVKEKLLDSNITISDGSIAPTQRHTKDIMRKVFLLAIAEVEGYDEYDLMQDEGPWLQYFQDAPREDHIARYASGRAESWWMRSASMWGSTSVWVVGPDSMLDNVQTGALLGVRPAFCLPGDLPVELRTGIKDGESVYVIDWPERQIAQ